MSAHKSLILILPYYGPLQPWCYFFLNSLRYQPSVQLLLVSDSNLPVNLSGNVTVLPFTISQLTQRIESTLGYPVAIQRPYKIADFKPAYGDIFSDEIKDYDYWAYTDMDIVLGNLYKFVGPLMEKGYDLISSYHSHCCGHFTAIKNTRAFRKLYQLKGIFKTVATDPVFWGFDETSWFRNGADGLPSFTSLVKEIEARGEIEYFGGFPIKDGIMAFRSRFHFNRVTLSDRDHLEFAYYHWYYMKDAVFFRFPKWHTIPDVYIFDFFGFYKIGNPMQAQLTRLRNHIPRNFQKAKLFFKTRRTH